MDERNLIMIFLFLVFPLHRFLRVSLFAHDVHWSWWSDMMVYLMWVYSGEHVSLTIYRRCKDKTWFNISQENWSKKRSSEWYYRKKELGAVRLSNGKKWNKEREEERREMRQNIRKGENQWEEISLFLWCSDELLLLISLLMVPCASDPIHADDHERFWSKFFPHLILLTLIPAKDLFQSWTCFSPPAEDPKSVYLFVRKTIGRCIFLSQDPPHHRHRLLLFLSGPLIIINSSFQIWRRRDKYWKEKFYRSLISRRKKK